MKTIPEKMDPTGTTYCEAGEALKQVAQCACAVSILGDFQKFS